MCLSDTLLMLSVDMQQLLLLRQIRNKIYLHVFCAERNKRKERKLSSLSRSERKKVSHSSLFWVILLNVLEATKQVKNETWSS